MTNYIIVLTIFTVSLFIINFFLKKFNVFTHSNLESNHKKFGSSNVPLSGGLFFFLSFFFLYKDFFLINNFILLLVIFFLALGLIVDLNIEINPKLRFLFQIFLTITLVLLGEIFIKKTNLFFLDFLLKSHIFNIFFSSFCILVLLNGLNFMDGVNNNVIGFVTLIFFSIIVIEIKNSNYENLDAHYYFLISLIVFYLFNALNKNYLGDSGIYILSIILSLLVITFINSSGYVSPLLAVNLLWYPAIETLFSIIRKLSSKKNPFKPDTLHLHTLLMKIYSFYKIKYANTLTGVSLNLALVPNFFIAINYFNHSIILIITTFIYIVLYLISYIKFKAFLKNKTQI